MTEATPRRKPGNPAFKKGVVQNPSGRPKQTEAEKKALADLRKLAPQAVKAIKEILLSSDDEKLKMRAAEIVLDRVYGKPHQSVDMSAALTGSLKITDA